MIVQKLRDFLNKHKIKYVCLMHSPAYTAQEIAEATHMPGKFFAKTVIVDKAGELAMVVVPANQHVNFTALRAVMEASTLDLVSESAFKNRFPDCEVGAMPPFGNLYDMPVYVAKELLGQYHLVFNAGTHAELVQLASKDYERIVKPIVFENK